MGIGLADGIFHPEKWGNTYNHLKSAYLAKKKKKKKQIDTTSSKANQTIGFLKRNLRINSSTVKDSAYKSLVRPELEFCSTVWAPKSVSRTKECDKTAHRLVDQLEMVQRRATRWVTGRYHNTSSVTDILHSLVWRTLEQRRVDSRLCMLYKIRNNLVAIEEDKYLQRDTGRRSHPYRQSFSFFLRTVMQWNQLPSQTCSATPLEAFKSNVTKVEYSRLN